jgi:hypothetical protein
MFPPLDPVLLWNTLFDKGLLALVVLLFGLLANRYLERFRSDRALMTEAAKLQLSRIGALWEDMNLWERDADRLIVAFCNVSIRALLSRNVRGTPAAQAPDVDEALQLIEKLQHLEFPPEAVLEVHQRLAPEFKGIRDRSQKIARCVDRDRFWLKDELYVAIKAYCTEIDGLSRMVTAEPTSMLTFKAECRRIGKRRQDVDDVIRMLITGK